MGLRWGLKVATDDLLGEGDDAVADASGMISALSVECPRGALGGEGIGFGGSPQCPRRPLDPTHFNHSGAAEKERRRRCRCCSSSHRARRK